MGWKDIIKKYVPYIVAHGLAWVLAAKFGVDASEADGIGAQAGQAAIAVVLVGWSIYDSVKGRKLVHDI